MDLENLNSWISQPDVCRCCLSASGTLDLTASYITDGAKEILSDMIQSCYGVTLSHLSEWGRSRLVCALCVTHLRDACNFRAQLLQAEKLFSEHSTNIEASADIAGDGLSLKPFIHYSPTHSDDDKEIFTQISGKVLYETHEETPLDRIRKSDGARVRKKRERRNIDSYDSDTPIAELKRIENGDMKENRLSYLEDKVGILKVHHPICANTKQVSERKRVILTCGTVLRETTACPFRHHKSWFQCFFCAQDFMEINLLRHHTLQTHADVDAELQKIKRFPRSLQIEISNLECRNCHLNLTDVDAMRRHFVETHNKVIYSECIADYKVDASPFTCHICKREFHVFRTLTTHLNEHYANCICDICGKSFLNSKRLKVHKRTHENGIYPCTECGKILKTKTSKANHMESMHSKRVIKCQICFKPMKHYNDRVKHMSEVHDITHKFKCQICGREYNIKHYLANHIRQTHGHKNKKCSECGMAFITNHGLKKHMLKHSGVKPYSCNVCSKSYARNYTLREHMRAHEN